MSENTNKPQKQFINGTWIREKQFANGGNILTLSVLPDRFIESIKAVKPDEIGFVRLIVSKRLNPDEKSSHTMYVDDWKPNGGSNTAPASKTAAPKKSTAKKVEAASESTDGNDF